MWTVIAVAVAVTAVVVVVVVAVVCCMLYVVRSWYGCYCSLLANESCNMTITYGYVQNRRLGEIFQVLVPWIFSPWILCHQIERHSNVLPARLVVAFFGALESAGHLLQTGHIFGNASKTKQWSLFCWPFAGITIFLVKVFGHFGSEKTGSFRETFGHLVVLPKTRIF